jgi:thioredoxin reductase
MHGYLSRDGIAPAELLAAGRDEVRNYGGDIVTGTATELTLDGPNGFLVLLDRRRISGRRLLVATGLRDELPDIPGLHDRWARDVLHCPYCHGHEVRDRRLGVIGGSPSGVRTPRSSASGPTTWSTSPRPTLSPRSSDPSWPPAPSA